MAQRGLRIGAGIALAALLAGCNSTPTPAPAPAPPPTVTPERTPQPPPPRASTPAPSRDACGAGPLQYLIGKPRTEIPVPVDPSKRRVICSTCMMTEDYQPWRQTIIVDSQTGLVREVRCG